MPTIKVWNYVKKLNSTGRPASEPLATYNITLKAPTSINAPVLLLDTGGTMPQFNYVLWEEINQYYYVSDIVSRNNNIFEIHCDLDALATARPYILNSSAFCKYIGDDNYINVYLRDDRIVPTADFTIDEYHNQMIELSDARYKSEMLFMISTYSDYDGFASYIIDNNTLTGIINKLITDSDSFIDAIKNMFADAKNSIFDIKVVPFTQSALESLGCIDSTTSPIHLGKFDTTFSGYYVKSYQMKIDDITYFVDDKIPTDFRICEPYTKALLYLPLYGEIDLPLDLLEGKDRLLTSFICNLATGQFSYSVGTGTSNLNVSTAEILGTYSGNCTFSLPIAMQTSANPLGGVTGIATTLGTAISAGAGNGALSVKGISASVASFLSFFAKQTTEIGAFSGNFSWRFNKYIMIKLYKRAVSEEPANMKSLYGRPCGKVVTLSGVTEGAYVETSQFSLAAPFDEFLINKVNQLMDSGVYLQ